MRKGILALIIIGIGILIGYLITTGCVALIFWLFKMGGYPIDFSIWIAGLVLYILWLLFGIK